jgi:hypothetical protein
MANVFIYENYWGFYNDIIASTYHPNFPAENTAKPQRNESWRSRYGAGSRWGRFVITANENDRLDFEETAGVNMTAVLTPGTYDAQSLIEHLKTQMEAVGGSTYTWEYIESGDDANHFRVTSDGAGGGGILNLEWNTGPNTARSIGDSIGFDVTADDTGALSYTADYLRIHTSESLYNDFGAQRLIKGAFVAMHNLQDGATCQIQLSNDDFVTIDINHSFTIQADLLGILWDTPRYYRYSRFNIEDVDNPDTYVEFGFNTIGPDFRPIRENTKGRTMNRSDLSIGLESMAGDPSSIQLPRKYDYDLQWNHAPEEDWEKFESMFADRGNHLPLWFIRDRDYYLSDMQLVKIAGYSWAEADKHYNINLKLAKSL